MCVWYTVLCKDYKDGQTTKLMGVTWEFSLERPQEMLNMAWRSHTRTQILR